MKTKLFLLLYFCVAGLWLQAQPQAIKYQAVARDADGNAVAEQQITLKLLLHSTSPTGTVVYAELHTPTTNEFGLINLEIGRGEIIEGTFSEIDWLSADYFIETQMDIAGGDNFVLMGTTQLLSVPYALSAGNAKTAQHSETAVHAETATVADGVILKDADGTPFKLTIGENGQLITECDVKAIDADGNEYKTVKIGNQIWMAENLNVGEMIDINTSESSNDGEPTDNNIIEQYCSIYENCEKYGGGYRWKEAMNYTFIEGTQGICPDGWRLPTTDDFGELADYFPSGEVAWTALKDGGSSGFNFIFTGSYMLMSGRVHVTQFWTSSMSYYQGQLTTIWTIGVGDLHKVFTNGKGGYPEDTKKSCYIRCIKN